MNVLFISIDTLRHDRLGCYGHTRRTSPHLDALAATGCVFETFTAPHIPTHPGYTTMFTGMDVFDHQIVTQGGKLELAEDIRMLPELLQERGYFTAAADNLHRWMRRGYDIYMDYQWEIDGNAWHKAESVNKVSMELMDMCEEQDKPWFCFLHYWDPHTPYLPPEPFNRMFYHGDETAREHTSALEMMTNFPAFMYYFNEWMPGCRDVEFPIAQYDAEIAYCDATLARLFDRLQSMPGIEDTMIIITSDHGEEFHEHQMWFDHHGLYDTNVHVPLIIVHPGQIQAGLRLGGLTRHMDLPPTILEYLGFEDLAEQMNMQGRSMKPLLDNRSHAGTTDRVYITENAWMKKRGFRTNKWKFIESLYDELHKRPPYELYDLTTDPGEQVNLADSCPDVLADFKAQLDEHIALRMQQTGKPDPQSYQDITLTHVGNMNVAIPKDQYLED